MADFSYLFQKHFIEWQKKLETILTMQTTKPSSTSNGPFNNSFNNHLPFEIQTDLTSLEKIHPPQNLGEKVYFLFAALTRHFEIGILLEKNDENNWEGRALFQNGEFLPLPAMRLMALPNLEHTQVLQGQGIKLLRTLGLKEIETPLDTKAHLIKPNEHFAFILFSRLPELWLKDYISKVQAFLCRHF